MNSTDKPLSFEDTPVIVTSGTFSPSAMKYCGKSALMVLVYGPTVEFPVEIVQKNVGVLSE